MSAIIDGDDAGAGRWTNPKIEAYNALVTAVSIIRAKYRAAGVGTHAILDAALQGAAVIRDAKNVSDKNAVASIVEFGHAMLKAAALVSAYEYINGLGD